MPLRDVLPLLDLAGICVFAASGALAAVRQRLDFVGSCFFALITATGGGTLHDVLIGAPIFWMRDAAPVALCVGVTAAAWLVPLHRWPARALEWLDAIGLAAYATFGAGKALEHGIPPVPAIGAGMITACVGGVIRDITAGVPSIILRHELYVSAALLAAATHVVLTSVGLSTPWPALCSVALGFALRAAAMRWNIVLPAHRGR